MFKWNITFSVLSATEKKFLTFKKRRKGMTTIPSIGTKIKEGDYIMTIEEVIIPLSMDVVEIKCTMVDLFLDSDIEKFKSMGWV